MQQNTNVVACTNFPDERLEGILRRNWYDQDLDWCDQRWQGEDTTVDVGFSGPVAMFQECVEDTAQTERWFNNIWSELFD